MIRLHTLGSLDLTDDVGAPARSVIQQPRRIALLIYLAAARPDRWYRRDTLLATFWPEADADHARASLSQAIYQLRRTLGSDVILSRGSEDIGLAPDAWCDAVEFGLAVREGKTEEALALYRGPFLDGFFISDAPAFEEWVEQQREAMRRSAVDGMGALAETYASQGAGPRAIELARRALDAAPTDEASLRRLLSILVRFGDRIGALRAYESFAAKLQAEYELSPSDATRSLIEAIRASRPEPDASNKPHGVATPVTEALPQLGERELVVPRSRTRSRRATVLLIGLLAIAVLSAYLGRHAIAAAGFSRNAIAPPSEADAGPSVAVLPFANMSAGSNGDYFSDGLSEQLITALTRVPNLRVAARTSAFAFKSTHASVRDIGRALGVRQVVEASVRQDGARLLITARLVDARDEKLVWSATYDRTLNDIFAVQEELSHAIVAAIEPRLVPAITPALVHTTRSVEAYNEFLKGRYAFNLRSPDHAMEGIQSFQRAVALDSTFAAAWSGLADAYALLPYFGLATGRDVLPKARAAAQRAAALDPTLADPHSTLGWIDFAYEWDWTGAEREFEEALRRNPSYPDALHFYSLFLSRVAGDAPRAITIIERAQRVDPLAPVIYGGAGAVYYHTRDYDKSIAAHLHALALDSTYWVARGLLAKTYVAARRPEDALRELRLIPPGLEGIHGGPAIRGVAFLQLGRKDSAQAMLAKLLRGQTRPYELAMLYTALHDTTAAFAALNRAVAERDPMVVTIRHDPLFDALRGDPRFESVSRSMKLPIRESEAERKQH